MDSYLPVLVGVGQVTNRPRSPSRLRTPMDLMEEAVEEAVRDAGADRLASEIDTVYVVNIISWTYSDPARTLAERIGSRPRRVGYTAIGGNSPQWLVNRACKEIASGEAAVVLIAGGEAFASGAAARNFGTKLERGDRSKQPEMIGETRSGLSNEEMSAQLVTPAQIYPIFENAYRRSLGRTIAEHQAALGALMESLNVVARSNPLAWFSEPRSAEEIANPSLENRMIAFPYTKYMNAVMKVDQAAALILCSAEKAQALGIPRDRWVFPVAGADVNDVWYFSRRPELDRSPAIAQAAKAVFEASGFGPQELDVVDLYSCFPVAVEVAAREIGLPADGSVGLTVTGGLPYFGGPGNNYSSHAIAEVAKRLRELDHGRGMVTALGWYITKHSVGTYSSRPPATGYKACDTSQAQKEIDCTELGWLEDDGALVRVVSYTVLYDRASNPERAPAIVEPVDGRPLRAIADVPLDFVGDPFSHDICGAEGVLRLGAKPRPVLDPR